MKYRLKDRELQAKLDEISGGDFSKTLDEWDFLVLRSKPGEEKGGISISFGPIGPAERCRFKANFSFEELEEVPEYDPHGWNSWPGVEPPEDVLMRLEIDFGNGKAFHTAYFAETIFDGLKAWFECYGIGAPQGNEGLSYEDQMLDDLYGFDDNDQPFIRETVKSVRFRPWEDEE